MFTEEKPPKTSLADEMPHAPLLAEDRWQLWLILEAEAAFREKRFQIQNSATGDLQAGRIWPKARGGEISKTLATIRTLRHRDEVAFLAARTTTRPPQLEQILILLDIRRDRISHETKNLSASRRARLLLYELGELFYAIREQVPTRLGLPPSDLILIFNVFDVFHAKLSTPSQALSDGRQTTFWRCPAYSGRNSRTYATASRVRHTIHDRPRGNRKCCLPP